MRLSSVLAKISAMRSVLEKAEKRSTGSGSSGGGSVFLGALFALGLGADEALDSALGLALGFTFGGTRVLGTGAGGGASGTEAELPGSAGSSGTGSWDS